MQCYSREFMEVEIYVTFAPVVVKKMKKKRHPDDSVSSYECSPEMKQVQIEVEERRKFNKTSFEAKRDYVTEWKVNTSQEVIENDR